MKIKSMAMKVEYSATNDRNEADIVVEFEDGSAKAVTIMADDDGCYDRNAVASAFTHFANAIAGKYDKPA